MTPLRASSFGGAGPIRSFIPFLAYLLIAIVMTWPLAPGLTRDVPGDLGDSLLNMWILGWGAEHVPRILLGQASLADYWNANIFHPEPLALAFSEHLVGEVIQIVPVYWLTGNLILCYNLLFISSFALSGLGMYLLVRDLLAGHNQESDLARGFSAAAFVAGLIFAFIPFRIAQVAHIQSLQAQWMPLALYGFRRYIVSGQWSSLAGGALALVMQNWSNGYYLIFFSPFVPIFVLHQMWTEGRLREWRVWAAFAFAAGVVVAATVPLLLPYLEAQRIHGFERSLREVIRFSADVYSYFTAPEALRVWGDVMQAYPKPEGELFFGVVPWLLAIVALLHLLITRSADVARPAGRVGAAARAAAALLIVIIVVQLAGFIAILFTGGFVTSIAGVPLRATNPTRILTGIVIASALLLVVSAAARRHTRALLRSPLALSATLMFLAMWLSLGPLPQSYGRALPGLGLYSSLYNHVPGFDGLRVPARYAMIAAVFLSIAAGYGVVVLRGSTQRLRPQLGQGIAVAMAVLFLIEAAFLPMPVNQTWGDGAMTPPSHVSPPADAPPVYHTLADMPERTVVAEFPFGDPAWELRYVYYSTVHWKRLLNGYSGGFPQGYKVRAALLQRVRDNPDAAWRALRDAGTTHVVVHQDAFAPGDAAFVTTWLKDHFAVEIARFGNDLLFDVTGVWPPK